MASRITTEQIEKEFQKWMDLEYALDHHVEKVERLEKDYERLLNGSGEYEADQVALLCTKHELLESTKADFETKYEDQQQLKSKLLRYFEIIKDGKIKVEVTEKANEHQENTRVRTFWVDGDDIMHD